MGDVVQGKQGESKEEINIDTPKIKMKLAKVDPNASKYRMLMNNTLSQE